MYLILIAALCQFSLRFVFSQETVGPQSATDTTTGGQAVDWDNADATAKAVATTDRDTGNFNYKPTSDYSSLFANQWSPVFSPVLPYGSRIQNPDVTDGEKDVLTFYPFFRRPDSYPLNFSVEASESKPPDNSKPAQVPGFNPYQTGAFLPRPDMLRYSLDSVGITAQNIEKQNLSASSPPPFFLGGPSARLNDPYPRYPYPMNGFYPPQLFYGPGIERIPAAPYGGQPIFNPPPRNLEDSTAFPQIDVFVNPPYVDREPGSEPAESVQPPKAAPPVAGPGSPSGPPAPVPVRPEVLPRQQFPLNPFPFVGFVPPAGFAPPPFGLPSPLLRTPSPPRVPPQVPTLEDNLLTSGLPVEPVKPLVVAPDNPLVSPPVVPREGGIFNTDAAGAPQGEPPSSSRIPYEFGYDMNDGKGTDQHRQETSDGSGAVTGSYGYRDSKGVYRVVNYFADKNGFRAFIKSNEPGVANPGSADVLVEAEVPPVQAIAEGLKQPRFLTVPVSGPEISADLIPQASEPSGKSDQSETVDQSETDMVNENSETSKVQEA